MENSGTLSLQPTAYSLQPVQQACYDESWLIPINVFVQSIQQRILVPQKKEEEKITHPGCI